MNILKNILKINPIIVKEIRSRMRGPRAFITLTLILLLTGGIMFAILQIILASSRYSTVLSPQIGQSMFAALAFLELFMICAVTPSVTAGAISSEKERLTYEMLMATPLSASSILWGKLISAMSYVFLLLFAAVPLASVVFIFGGVAPRDMLKVLFVLLVIAVSFGILGLFMSALFGRTGRATIASFIVVFGMMLGPLLLAILFAALNQGKEPPRWILAPSPISALSAALTGSMGRSGGGEFFYILSGIFNMGISPISQTSIPRPLYHYSIPLYTMISVVLYLISTRLIQPARRWNIRRKELITGLLIIVVVAGILISGFLLSASRYEWAGNQQIQTGATMDLMSEPSVLMVITPTPAEEKVVIIPDGLNTTPTPQPNQPFLDAPLTENEMADIYSAIARQLFTIDHTFDDSPPDWQTLYLINITDDSVGDPEVEMSGPALIAQTIQDGIIDKLSDLPTKVIWVNSRNEAPTNSENGMIDDGGGALITFGNIHPQEDGTLHVSASLYFSGLGATGKTYILSKIDGEWQVTGSTGVQWIS